MVGIIRYTISLFTVAFASLAWAVSIYDVIELSRQGYSDEEVVKIIRSTGSVFELTAEDIPRLKNLGVSDAIIRSMLMEPSPAIIGVTFKLPLTVGRPNTAVYYSATRPVG